MVIDLILKSPDIRYYALRFRSYIDPMGDDRKISIVKRQQLKEISKIIEF